MTANETYLDQVLSQITDVRAWLAEVETRIERLKSVAPTSTVDEDVAAAGSVTAVHKALERELGVDRRTVLSYVERLVKAHGVAEKVPDWSTNLKFAKYCAAREANGKVRLRNAIDALKGAAA